jgi:precorrin-3B methylase
MDIKSIISAIKGVFISAEPPLEPLPAPLIISGSELRPGLNSRVIAARIIARQSEAGAPQGLLSDGSRNIAEAMEVIRVEEILNALLTEAKIEIAVAPGVSVSTTGVGNLGAPVVSQGATVSIISGNGIIR